MQTTRAPSRETSGIRSTQGKYKFHGGAWSFVNGTWAREKKRCHELSRDVSSIPPLLIVNRNLKTNGWTIQNCRHSMIGGLILGNFGCSFPGTGDSNSKYKLSSNELSISIFNVIFLLRIGNRDSFSLKSWYVLYCYSNEWYNECI